MAPSARSRAASRSRAPSCRPRSVQTGRERRGAHGPQYRLTDAPAHRRRPVTHDGLACGGDRGGAGEPAAELRGAPGRSSRIVFACGAHLVAPEALLEGVYEALRPAVADRLRRERACSAAPRGGRGGDGRRRLGRESRAAASAETFTARASAMARSSSSTASPPPSLGGRRCGRGAAARPGGTFATDALLAGAARNAHRRFQCSAASRAPAPTTAAPPCFSARRCFEKRTRRAWRSRASRCEHACPREPHRSARSSAVRARRGERRARARGAGPRWRSCARWSRDCDERERGLIGGGGACSGS